MKDLGAYGNTNLTNILINEFILGTDENLTLSANELVNEVKNKVANAPNMEDFAQYASQSCSNLIVSMKFQGYGNTGYGASRPGLQNIKTFT
jgi:hypothetical protein